MAYKFNIQPVNRFEKASIRRPKVRISSTFSVDFLTFDTCILQEFTHFSYDDDYKLHFDDRSIRYYYPPSIGVDLSQGFETFQKRDETVDGHIDGLLKSIVNFEQKSGTECKADIVTWRGLLTKVTLTFFSLER